MTRTNLLANKYCRYNRNNLPEWFNKPIPNELRQHSLFPLVPSEFNSVLASLCISLDDLSRWRRQGWVSFDFDDVDKFEQWHINEVWFVQDVVRSGLSDAQIEALLEELPRPMDFDPAKVAYSFSLGWVQVIQKPEPDPDDYMEEHLDDWLQELSQNDPDRLKELRDQIDGIINTE